MESARKVSLGKFEQGGLSSGGKGEKYKKMSKLTRGRTGGCCS